MDSIHGSIECLCNSHNRLRMLVVLDRDRMDVRDLVTRLDSSRSTVQRNLSVLEEHGYIESTIEGYTTTTIGTFLYQEFMELDESIKALHRMAPFFKAVDSPPDIDMRMLSDVVVTIPEPERPDAPIKHLSDAFNDDEFVHGCYPAISYLVASLLQRGDSDVPEHEYVVPAAVIDVFTEAAPDRPMAGSKPEQKIELRRYDYDIPYGLFVSEARLVLTAYDEAGRIAALVESTTEGAVNWGEHRYETYRRQSTLVENAMTTVRHEQTLAE